MRKASVDFNLCRIVLPANHEGIRTRRKLSSNGAGAVVLVVSRDGELLADPELILQGLPTDDDVKNIAEEGSRAVEDAVNALSDTSRQDDARMAEAARVTLRRLIRSRLGKNAIVEARIIRVE